MPRLDLKLFLYVFALILLSCSCSCISTASSGYIDYINGGWKLDSDNLSACRVNISQSVCNFHEITDCEISQDEFRTKFWKMPTIIRGCSKNINPRNFFKEEILEKFGKIEFPVGNAESLYLGKSVPRHWKMKLEDYIRWMDSDDERSDHIYLFEWYENLNDEAKEILKSFNTSQIFSRNLGSLLKERVLALGAHGAGVPFHFHGPAWNELIFGRKRWFMYPISHSPGGGYNELLDQSYWYDEMYQKLLPEEMPFECHQLPGDIVFVPEGFYHATINCGQSIGIAALVPDVMKGHDTNQMEEAGPITNLANAMSAHSAGNKELSLLLLQKAHRQAPKNDVIAYYLGVRYVELDNLEDGIPMLKKSLRLNPLRVAAYRDLAIARFRDGFPNRALKSLQVGISHCPEFPTETCIDLYKMAADLYARNGNQRKFNEMKSIADEMESKFGRIPKQGPQQFPLEFI